MAQGFDLRRQLKLHDRTLLRKLFGNNAAMQSIPWDTMAGHDVERIVAGWEADPVGCRQFEAVLREVHLLSDARGQRVLIEELQLRFPHKVAEFAALPSPADKALWAHLEAPLAFEEAALFARADALRGGQFANRWNSLPKQPITVSDDRLRDLESSIRDHYWKQELRGDRCRVNHFSRPNGDDVFFAYLPDWPEKYEIFDDEGNFFFREGRLAFSNLFVFSPADGAVEIVARGGQKVQLKLRKAFCKAVLGIEVEDQAPQRKTYHLDHLIDPDYTFTWKPEEAIAAVGLRRIRIQASTSVGGVEHFEVKFEENATRREISTVIAQMLSSMNLDRSQVSVTQASVQIRFQPVGDRRGKSLTFNVSCPNSSDLKSKPEDIKPLLDRLVREWRILRD
jgi:hypothetical protein